jgi:hypothetical protein
MKTLASFLSLIFCLNLTAQENDKSLQVSLDKTLDNEKSKIENFEANVNLAQNAVQLKWETSPFSSTAQYIIEKSTDKISWKNVATVYGAEHKNHEMEFVHIDFKPFENLSYYRLIQKDKDEKELFSNIVPVKYYTSEYNTAGINLYPVVSETDDVINISFEDIFEKEILIVVRDKNGEEFYSKVVINIEEEVLVAVPIESEVPKGDYLITATSENQIYSQNIVIK